MRVSIVIPARNAEATLAETLAAVQAQTLDSWEALVVDDGSDDGTLELVGSSARTDPRLRVVTGPKLGVSAARNRGIAEARGDLLFFLDADDLIVPETLERLTAALDDDPTLGAVHCGWCRLAPDGAMVAERPAVDTGDLFETLARYCVFPVHACLTGRDLLRSLGGFDTGLACCEDWDLWQRVARTGLRFGAVADVMSIYRMRPGSASLQARRFLEDGLVVLGRTHASDPRVPNPAPEHRNGLRVEDLPSRRLYLASWIAGLLLGAGEDGGSLLDLVAGNRDPQLDPTIVADCLHESTVLPSCLPPSAWHLLWPSIATNLETFLVALENLSRAGGLARRSIRDLEGRILAETEALLPVTVGSTRAIRLDTTRPIEDITGPPGVRRLSVIVDLDGKPLGNIELPICDGCVPRLVLADAICASFAWEILGLLFERTVYRELRIEHDQGSLRVWRDDLCLAEDLPESLASQRTALHDAIGWTMLLQEVWGKPGWPVDRFYDPEAEDQPAAPRSVPDGWFRVEISQDPPDLRVDSKAVDLVPTVGGVALGVVPAVEAEDGVVHAAAVRAAVTTATGFELARAVVREAILGRRLEGPPIRTRLAEAATAVERLPSPIAATTGGSALAPGWESALSRVLAAPGATVLANHRPTEIGGGASRYAALPVRAAAELVRTASLVGQPSVTSGVNGASRTRAIYLPELAWRPTVSADATAAGRRDPVEPRWPDGRYGRHYFEGLFAAERDPWQFSSPYETRKYEQTLDLLPVRPVARALELGCAEGHFTTRLAPRVTSLVAADISQIALDRTRQRCTGLDNVEFVRLDMVGDPLPGRFDLIVCSEALYYVGGEDALDAVGHKLADALEPGGHLVTAHAHAIADAPDEAGFDWGLEFGAKRIGEILSRHLDLVEELKTPLYRIQRFRRRGRFGLPPAPGSIVIRELPQPVPVPPRVAGTARWNGGEPTPPAAALPATTTLPILMYHRITDAGPAGLADYRTAPKAFEEQLRYLCESGYRSVTLRDWGEALRTRTPLPESPVLLTFDDGCADFATTAWPLLRTYGFSATVFLVSDAVGGRARWDRELGEEAALLDWETVLGLRDEGVDFGSHTATHTYLTSLSPEEVAGEAVRSRQTLQLRLGYPPEGFAYPYGDVDGPVSHIVRGVGYSFGLTIESRLSTLRDDPLLLPRIEVRGSYDLEDFINAFSGSS